MQTHYKNPAIKKAFTVLERLSEDEETRYHAELREEALKFQAIELAAAEKKGELIGEIRMAQKILKQPVTSRDELTQKSVEELQKLFENLEAYLNKLSIVEREDV